MAILADAPLRRARALQLARRACLGASLAFALLVPLWHAQTLDGPPAPVVGAPWSVDVFGLEILEPLAFLGLLAAGHASVALLVGALPALVLVVVLGRYFCGWLCPYALLVAASDAARVLLEKRGARLLNLKLSPRIALVGLAVLLVATAVGGGQLAALVYPPSVIHRAAWKLVATGSAGAGLLVVGAAFLFDVFVSRAGFCRALCPGGAVFRLLSFASPVRVERTASTCTSCRICDEVCHFAQSPMTDHLDAGCERCARCVSACPTGSLDLVAIGRRPR
jgi:ferredoxin-type protein NapH